MPHIFLPEGYPGIRSLFNVPPCNGRAINRFVQVLLHDETTSTLTPEERELIATYTSHLNTCKYCANTHGAIAQYQLGNNPVLVEQVRNNPDAADISYKMKGCLKLQPKYSRTGRRFCLKI